jgi:hypothetical protein
MTASPLIKCLCSRRHLPNLRFGIRSIRVDQDSDDGRLGNQLV